jgi:hypothetical protein
MAGSKHHYVYRSYEPLGRSYIGKRSCLCPPEEDVNYLGSYSDSDFYPTQKEILAICESSEHALGVEIFFHEFYDVARNPMFANKAKQTSKFFNTEGVPKSEQHRQKIKDSLQGIPKTETHRRSLSLAKQGKPASEACRLAQIEAVKGKPKSAEHRRKIAQATTGRKMGEESKKKMALKRSENNLGRSWWVNEAGNTMFQHESPGPDWQKGRKWVTG